jgi:predicted RNA-binding protein with PUA-like domain
MKYRLIKSEPYKYSRQQFTNDKKTMRDGVRNYQARNNLISMKKWDLCLWYHSNEWKEIVGIAKVITESYPDPTVQISEKWDWVVVDLVPHKTLSKPLSLEYIKTDKKLAKMMLLKQQRLSVTPVTPSEFAYIVTLCS